MRDIFKDYPDLNDVLVRFGNDFNVPTDDIKNLLELVGEIRYKDGLIDGMKHLMEMLLKNDWWYRLGWAAILGVSLMAARASSWPYGVIMSIKTIF